MTYLAYRLGMPSYSLIIVTIIIGTSLLFIRALFTQRHCGIPVYRFFKDVVLTVTTTVAVALVVPVYMANFVVMTDLIKLVTTTGLWIVCLSASIYIFGLTGRERAYIKQAVKKIIRR